MFVVVVKLFHFDRTENRVCQKTEDGWGCNWHSENGQQMRTSDPVAYSEFLKQLDWNVLQNNEATKRSIIKTVDWDRS